MKRVKFLAASASAVAAFLCGTASADTPSRGGTLTYAVQGFTSTLDCHAASSFSNIHYLAPHYSLLVKFDPKDYPKIVPDLAESWSVSDDGLVFTFKIREGVKFHDGSTLTAEDVKATYERIWKPGEGVVSVRAALLEDIASIDAPDPRTVVFRLEQPNAGMLSNFASPWNCIYSARKLAEDPLFPTKTVMGTGPFVHVEHVAGSHWIGKRFDDYFREGLPYLDGFRAQNMTATAIVNALAGGQIQAEFRGFAPADAERIKKARGSDIAFAEGEWLAHFFFSFNADKKPFDDPRVRRALTMAVDRWGGAEPMSKITFLKTVGGLMRPGSEMALRGDALIPFPGFSRDIKAARAEAKRLLAEAGVPNLSFTLTNRVTAPFIPLGLFLIDQWRQIGVTVTHQQLDTAQWLATRRSGSFEVVVDSQAEWNDDPSVQLNRFISFDRSDANVSRYVDREIDELYEKQRMAIDPAERERLVLDMQGRLLEHAYSGPGFWSHRNVALDKSVKGWVPLPSHMLNQDLAEIWLAR